MSVAERQYGQILSRLSTLRRREPFVREVEEAGQLLSLCTELNDAAERCRLALQADGAVLRAAERAEVAGSRDAARLRELHSAIQAVALAG